VSLHADLKADDREAIKRFTCCKRPIRCN